MDNVPLEDRFIYKIISCANYNMMDDFILNEPADEQSMFIHACPARLLRAVRAKFYGESNIHILCLNKQAIENAGFRVVYESNRPGGDDYWHFYRSDVTKLLPTSAILYCETP
jgi:uncharacterized protein (DUF952 family)